MTAAAVKDRPWRSVYVDPTYTVLDSALECADKYVRRTRGDAFDHGLAGLLDPLAPFFDREGVVLIGEEGAEVLKLPGRVDEDGRGAAVAEELRAAGWKTRRVSDWTTVTGDGRPKLRVCNLAAVDTRPVTDELRDHEFPLWSPFIPDTVAALRMWHELTGSAYHGTPGMAGMTIMGALERERMAHARDGAPVTWKGKRTGRGDEREWIDGPEGAFEDDFRKSYWTAPDPRKLGQKPLPWLHSYDAIRMYIAAAMLVEVSPWRLKHSGKMAFDPRRAGWWLVELSPWDDPRMPDPAGYVPLVGAEDRQRLVRPVTTPTVGLLDELTKRGDYGGYRILDSWTGPARKYPLRAYAERMRDAYAWVSTLTGEPHPVIDEGLVETVRRALKRCGHKTFGFLDHADNWAYRSHWWYSIVALARCNLWRKARHVGQATGRWPAWIDVDNLWYPSDDPDPVASAPAGIIIDPAGLQLGRFTSKGSRKLRRSVLA